MADVGAGGLYGSSFLNEGFRELLQELLVEETYLNQGADTITGHIETIMINHFEYRVKRNFDCYLAQGVVRFPLPGLRDNEEKNFRRGCIYIPV